MDRVATLVCNPARPILSEDFVALAVEALGAAQARVGAPISLAPGVAVDIPFDGLAAATAGGVLRRHLGRAPVDLAVQDSATRRKRLLVADMESTIIENEMLDEVADFLGVKEQVAAITARAMNGEIDFAGALRDRIGLARGLPVTVLDEAAKRIRTMAGARELVATMRANGAYCALVSGGFTYYTAMVARDVGFDEHRANVLKIENGKLLGEVEEPILGREAKLAALKELAAAKGAPIELTMAVGDGANDLPMLKGAGLGVAYYAKPAVAAEVPTQVSHGDLTALLYFQGYRRDRFVA